jgi:hypothetical protein
MNTISQIARGPGKTSLTKFYRERSRYAHISKPLELVEVDRMVVTENGIEFRKVPELQVTKLRGVSRRGSFPTHVSLRRQRQLGANA